MRSSTLARFACYSVLLLCCGIWGDLLAESKSPSRNAVSNLHEAPNGRIRAAGDLLRRRKARIRGGSVIKSRSAMPYIGRINTCFYPLGRFTCILCSGVLLNRKWFLTAAHCVSIPIPFLTSKGVKVKSIKVTLGELNKDDTAEEGTVLVDGDFENVRTAGNFDAPFRNNDLALVKLTQDVPEKKGLVEYAKLPASRAELPEGTPVLYFGWGFHKPEDYLLSSKLRSGSGTVVPQASCNVYDPQAQFCTQSAQSVCFGDAGGPVVRTSNPGTVVGIISYNTPNCPAEKGQYRHTLVSAYVDWIDEVTRADL